MTEVVYKGRREYAGIDYFRIAAAVMVIAIHTAPFSVFGKEIDFGLTYCIGRVAVPFFLMTTGYFVLGPWKLGKCADDKRVIRPLKKTLFLYAAAFVLYLPVNFYAGGMPKSAGGFLRMLFFDGAFYHLWYFPAVVTGCILVAAMLKRFPVHLVVWLAGLLYLIGAGGDSYYGLASRIPAVESLYDMLFAVSSYTRNGIFYAPVFLVMGMLIRAKKESDGRKRKTQERRGRRSRSGGVETKGLLVGLMVSMALMLIEGYLTYSFDLQRHNSMYLFLIPVMYFLFRLLLCIPGDAPACTRDISMLVYIIHPAVLIGLRGIAGAAGLTAVLVDNALMQFLSVTVVSFMLTAALVCLSSRLKKGANKNE